MEARAAADCARFRDALERHIELRPPLRRVLRRAARTRTTAARRLRAGHDDGGGAADVRDAARGLRGRWSRRPPRRRAARRRRVRRPLRGRGPACVPSCAMLERVGFDSDGLAARRDAAPVRAVASGHGDIRITTRYDVHDLGMRTTRRCTSSATASTSRHPARTRAQARSARRSRSASTSRRAGSGRTSSGAAAPFWRWRLPHLRRTLAGARRRRRRTASTAPSTSPAVAHPRRGRRDDLQPPHHRCASSSSWR